MRALPVVMAASVASGVVGLTAAPVQAHTPTFSADCSGVRLQAVAYDGDMDNRWRVTVGGQTFDGTFGSGTFQRFPVPQNGETTTWSAMVEAEDGTFHFEDSGTVGPCGQPPRPSDVVRVEQGYLEGCDLKVRGVKYGAGELTWDETFIDTWRWDNPSQQWVQMYDNHPDVSGLLFTPWSTQEQIANGCVDAPPQPAPIIERDRSVSVDCTARSRVVTVRTTITRWVYDQKNNRWVKGDPETSSRTFNNPLQPGDCGVVGGTQGGNPGIPASPTPGGTTGATPPGSGPVAAPNVAGNQSGAPNDSGASVPGAVDSGLAGSRAMSAVASAGTLVDPASRNLGAGLLLLGGLLLGFVPRRQRVATKHRA